MRKCYLVWWWSGKRLNYLYFHHKKMFFYVAKLPVTSKKYAKWWPLHFSTAGVSTGDWTYEPSTLSAKVNDEGRTYYDPQTGQFFYVEKIPSVTSRFSDMWGVAVSTLAAIGVFSSLALFIYLLVVYPVRGGTSILGYVLAFGIILLYGLVFAFVAHASMELCGLRRLVLFFYGFSRTNVAMIKSELFSSLPP